MNLRDKRFWMLLIAEMMIVMLIRTPSPPIRLPEAVHNTIGDLPILEQADDGYVSSVEEKPKWGNKPAISMSYIEDASRSLIFYSGSTLSDSIYSSRS